MQQKYIGAGLIVLGIVTTASGLEVSRRPRLRTSGADVSRSLNPSAWRLIEGVLLVLAGLCLLAIHGA